MATIGIRAVPGSNRDGMAALFALCAAAFAAQVNFYATGPFYEEMARDLHTSVPLLGQITTLLLMGSAVLGVIVGPLADRTGYRRLLVVGLLAIGGNLLGASIAPAYLVLLPLASLGAVGDAMVFGLTFAMAAMLFTGEARRRAISWTMASLSGGAILGVPALTAIGGVAGWRVAVACAGIVALAAAGMAAVLLPGSPPDPHPGVRWRELAGAYAPLLADRSMLRLLALTLARALWFLTMATYLGAYLQGELGLPVERVGIYYLLLGVGATAGNLLAGGRFTLCAARSGIVLVNLAGGILAGLCLLSGAHALIVSLILTAILSGSATVGIATALANESEAGTGTTMTMHAVLMNAGGAGGAAIGGMLLAAGGFPALAISLPLVAVIGAIVALLPGGPERPLYDVQ